MINNLFSVDEKVIILTGGTGYLGTQYNAQLIKAGAKMIIWDKNGEEPVDICDEVTVRQAVRKVIQKFGRIDVLINNAALNARASNANSADQFLPYEEYPIDLWEKELKVNLTGMMICTKTVASTMIKQKSGSIINVASELSVIAHDHRIYADPSNRKFKSIAYTTTKSAILGFTRQWAARLGEFGIRVNTFSPAGVLKNTQTKDFVERYGATTMLGRMSKTDDLIGPLVFLCSDASSFMTGQNLIIDGGRTAW